MDLEEMYRQVILEHAKTPHNSGRIEKPDVAIEKINRLCGDELVLTANLEPHNRLFAKIEAKGCAIVQASSSLMTDFIKGKTPREAQAAGTRFKALLEGSAQSEECDPETLEPLLTLKQHRSRHRCVLLPWEALDEACRALEEQT